MSSSLAVRQLPVRLPEDLYDRLKTYAFLTGRPMNEAVVAAVREWLTDERLVEVATEHGQARYRMVLDKLRDL